MSADLKIDVSPDLKSIRDRLADLDSGGQTKLVAALNKELRDNIGKKVTQEEKSAIMRTQIKGRKDSGDLRHKRGTRKSTGLRRRISESFEYKNRLSNPKQASIVIRASTSKLIRNGLSPNTARRANNGALRHPLFGDRENWYDTVFIPRGYWDKTRRDLTPYVNRQIELVATKFESVILDAMRGKH